MPTASTDSEKKGPVEAQTPIKQAIAIVERKVRNLEKRKTKLDNIKQKAASGGKLELDQKNAIEHYEEVIQTLEYSRELQKQFAAISNEAGKLMKKQARREKLDRQLHEIKRIQELLQVQNLLDSLGSQNVRSDFQTGKHGAVVLTEENLNQLDELYQLISPTREGEDYHKKLNAAAEHIVSLLESKQKEVIGTTYKDLKELIDLISGCGYFEAVQKLENEESAANTAAVAEVDEAVDEEDDGGEDVESSEDGKTESQPDEPALDLPVSQPPQEVLTQAAPPQLNNMAQQGGPAAYYANEVFPQPSQRPIDEIVSSVQGSFNFLQESTIDVDSAPHIDPAVVAAQPMPRSSAQQTPDTTLSGFATQAYDQQNNPTPAQTSQHTSNNLAEQQQQRYQSAEQTTLSQQNMDYPSSQQFRQNALSQNIQTDSMFPPAAEDTAPISHGMMNQTGSDNSMGQYDIPPSIPLPQSQDNQQPNISNQPEKKFTMNAAAPVFQSMYSQAGVQEQIGDGLNHSSQNADSNGANNFQNNRYQNDGFQQRGPRREGSGYRGRGGRGGNTGGNNSNMQNGFNRNAGGGNVSGGPSSGRGGRGGQYQGYSSRNNYQSDGYQGYNNSGGGFNQGYKQRGGGSGGQMRGSGGSDRGGMRNSGGMRGGGPSRNNGNSAPRTVGARGNGVGRPNSGGQFQQ
ncbi:caprin-1-like [Haliotis cracherodii]|uniref:caprin-1-like n=1 Tax=Haliotis cracherodii TaxID=6455 RepID=UPI0039EBE8FA